MCAGRGVLFFACLSAACADAALETPTPTIERVTIGVPQATSADVLRVHTGNFILESLVKIPEDGRPEPWLAESWSWESGYRKLRIKLRPNVFLHDGRRLDAALATELLRPAIENPTNRSVYATLNDVVAITPDGDLDIVITLSRPSALLPGDLAIQLRTGQDGLIGTGPYRIASSSDAGVVLTRFDAYYRGTPTIKEVVMKPHDTLRAAWTGMLRGDVDVVLDVPADAIEFIRNDDVQVMTYPRRYQLLVAFNSRTGPLRSPAVRRALNMAVDRDGIATRVLQDSGMRSTGPIWPKFWAYDPSVPPIPFDPRQAARLLEEDGYPLRAPAVAGAPPARFRFTCLIPREYSVWERVALEVQQDLLTAGVDMQLRVVSVTELNKLIGTGAFDAVLLDMFGGPSPDRAYAFWRSRQAYQGPLNMFGYQNAEAERLFATLSGSTNDAAVRSATRGLQETLLSDPPAIFIAWTNRARAVSRAFVIPGDESDPLLSLWKWTPTPAVRLADNR